jgi:hypothetical protein
LLFGEVNHLQPQWRNVGLARPPDKLVGAGWGFRRVLYLMEVFPAHSAHAFPISLFTVPLFEP